MTEHDGMTAAEQTYCAYCNAVYRIDDDIALIQAHIYECPEHPLPKALARAEAAEARVAELLNAVRGLQTTDDTGLWWCWACDEVTTVCTCPAGRLRALAAPTTEAVTEVEGS